MSTILTYIVEYWEWKLSRKEKSFHVYFKQSWVCKCVVDQCFCIFFNLLIRENDSQECCENLEENEILCFCITKENKSKQCRDKFKLVSQINKDFISPTKSKFSD